MNNMKTKLSENSLFGASGRGEIMGAHQGRPQQKQASKQKAKQQALSKDDVINRQL